MKDPWGRVESQAWPSDKPVWTRSVYGLTALVVCVGLWLQYQTWSPLQRYWLPTYLSARISPLFRAPVSAYRLMLVLHPDGITYLPQEDEVEPGSTKTSDGLSVPFALSDEARRQKKKLVLTPASPWKNALLSDTLRAVVYRGQTWMDWAERPLLFGGAALSLGLAVAIPKDRENLRIYKHGRRLRGAEEVTAAEFNRRNQSDGVAFLTLEPPKLAERLRGRDGSRVCIPRSIEDNHFLIMGDSGSGKSTLIRRLLTQIAERGETAIVYDPALEYTGQFYSPERGDIILNPLDERMPYWPIAEEVIRPAEALTLATALFPETDRDNPFFKLATGKTIAYLLNLKPTPQELLAWLSDEHELERRLKGTPLAAMIYEDAGPQRGGVLASLSMVADSLQLLPAKTPSRRILTIAKWAEEVPQGWAFLTSIPEARAQTQGLISMWLDMMILRLMNQGRRRSRPVWFVLDELASLNRLPQLPTAITQNRKSGNPVVLCFQGRSQLEAIYGHQAEVMFSQPSTKIFLKTSEPRAARWISDTLGDVEIERLRESRTHGQMPHPRESRSFQLEHEFRPLIMKEEITGLPKGHGFLKCGNLVVRMSFPYLKLPERHPAFVERKSALDGADGSPSATNPTKPSLPFGSTAAEERRTPPSKPNTKPDTDEDPEQTKFFK